MQPKNQRRLLILCSVGILLLIPLIAMQFTNEVRWTFTDFMIAGILLLGLGSLIELIILNVQNRNYKVLFYILLLVAFLLLWVELSVGIFDSPLAGR
ncbi:hypothetical protein [uncultured Dokdonia sp.]|uniref:hypothetical protein n=1 Tax=uncultured Dokdonia sp. TaxID=575653 RepID=UPI00260316D5|nr:hypothetical protein [uncultured Dokdonia sp.]